MAADVSEEELLRSIEEVEAKIKKFRKKVRAVLAAAQLDSQPSPAQPHPQPGT